VHATDQAEHAVQLVRRTALAEGVHASLRRPVLHGDNGASLKATTVLAMLHWLGIAPSHSRPRVSDDNAFAEALFRTAKYCPSFPSGGFADLAAAQCWAAAFARWYNLEHRHSGIRYVTPAVSVSRSPPCADRAVSWILLVCRMTRHRPRHSQAAHTTVVRAVLARAPTRQSRFTSVPSGAGTGRWRNGSGSCGRRSIPA
jgi:hypothetical protein